MRLVVIILLLFLSGNLLTRGYRGRSHYKNSYYKDSPVHRFSMNSRSYGGHHRKRHFSKHAYRMLKNRITYLKSLQASKEVSIDPVTGEKSYAYPETSYTFPGSSNLIQGKFKKSKYYQKYVLTEPSGNLEEIEKGVDKVRKEAEPPKIADSCERAIETRKKLMKKNDKKTEMQYLKYKTMCEEK